MDSSFLPPDIKKLYDDRDITLDQALFLIPESPPSPNKLDKLLPKGLEFLKDYVLAGNMTEKEVLDFIQETRNQIEGEKKIMMLQCHSH